ncbi:unnamed protein product [Chilo suppressalis]|uniref:DALR anticodon binding domain-containing protein n=1 Tax=Chilo suppressalis TaxID=168631 RepID=A0ABN8AUG9_CHISP|nr:hypothetical protein evm_006458 [Chilo suppressalis]CAH0399679.1 unnamed protein product [Chilo suppressalis]
MLIENVLDGFCDEIYHFLIGKSKLHKGLLVKKHSENLQQHGDFSFPNTIKSWHQYLERSGCSQDSATTLLKYLQKENADLVNESKLWHLELIKVKLEKDRVHLFLNRPKSIYIGLREAININRIIAPLIKHNSSCIYCDINSEDSDCLTMLRLKYLAVTIEKLYSIFNRERECWPNIFITTKSSQKKESTHSILCGAVLNTATGGKETNIKADDYIRMRQNEMILIAQHKYGVRVSMEEKWKEFIDHLGESAVVFELLQTKPGSAVKINFECSSAGSSKGAAFVLYNCARLEALIRSYNEKVVEGIYPTLPDIENTDLSLLTNEDEWCLVFNYIMGFPSMLENCVEVNEKTCEFRPHLLCSFLCSMVRVFSQYYRKVRVLTEPRKHLLPVLFARLHMLTILNDTLKTCLNILNIKSVSQM